MLKIHGTKIKGRGLFAFTGTTALDSIIGDGVPNSSLIFIDELKTRKFFKPIARCFLAEGIESNHTILCASSTTKEIDDILNNLPICIENDYKNNKSENLDFKQNKMSAPNFCIAWRYNSLPKIESSIQGSKSYCLKYDLHRKSNVDLKGLEESENLIKFNSNLFQTFSDLWTKIYSVITQEKFSINCPENKQKFLRILITDLSFILWTDSENLIPFLIHLKSFCRHSNCITLIGLDSSLILPNILNQIIRLSDIFIKLEYIIENNKKAMNLYQQFDGRFYIKKLSTILSPASHRPECLDLIFSLKRSYFEIKKLYLPPAIENKFTTEKKINCQHFEKEF